MSDPSSLPASSRDPDDSHGGASSPSGDGGYVVVARRYRPRGFDELVGQEHVGRALKNAIETSRVGHAYLFTGARGVGKTSTARIFAKALNDPSGPTASPDNSSDVAQAIDSGEDVDVIEIDGASNRGIDEIRSLRANVGVRPSRSRFKIYIIDEVHMLTGAAFNALLKTLEEPPEHVKFIFCTTDPEKIPITVLSRCQRFDFAPVEVGKIITRLQEIVTAESAEADEQALELIARRAAGSMRDSQSLLEQVLSFSDGRLTAEQVHQMLGTADDVRLHAMASAMSRRDAADALRQLDAAIDAGVDAGRMAEQLLGYFRDLMAVAVGCDAAMLRHTSAALHDELKSLGDAWGLQTVLAVVALVDQTLVRIRHSVHARVLLEATLIQICHLPDLQRIADLADAAGGVKRPAAKGSNPPGEKKNSSVAAPHFDRTPMADAAVSATPVAQAAAVRADPVPTGRLPSQAGVATQVAEARSQDVPTSQAGASPPAAESGGSAAVAMGPAAATEVVVSKPAPTTPWTAADAQRLWKAALGHLEAMPESMTESMARAVRHAEPIGPARLRLVFPSESKLAMSRCELPEHKAALHDALTRAAGHEVSWELALLPPKEKPKQVESAAPRPSRMQRMREIEAHPLVRSCVELFGAEIVRVEKPR